MSSCEREYKKYHILHTAEKFSPNSLGGEAWTVWKDLSLPRLGRESHNPLKQPFLWWGTRCSRYSTQMWMWGLGWSRGEYQYTYSVIQGTNLVLGTPEKFYCRKPSGMPIGTIWITWKRFQFWHLNFFFFKLNLYRTFEQFSAILPHFQIMHREFCVF